MAKSLRARSKKVNRSKLRTTVFGPIEDARTERLSTKLIELALSQTKNQPSDYQSLVKTDEARNMELNTLATQHGEKEEPQPVGSQSEHKTVGASDAMEVDEPSKQKSRLSSKASRNRVTKQRHKKRAQSSVIFPAFSVHRKAQGGRFGRQDKVGKTV